MTKFYRCVLQNTSAYLGVGDMSLETGLFQDNIESQKNDDITFVPSPKRYEVPVTIERQIMETSETTASMAMDTTMKENNFIPSASKFPNPGRLPSEHHMAQRCHQVTKVIIIIRLCK